MYKINDKIFRDLVRNIIGVAANISKINIQVRLTFSLHLVIGDVNSIEFSRKFEAFEICHKA